MLEEAKGLREEVVAVVENDMGGTERSPQGRSGVPPMSSASPGEAPGAGTPVPGDPVVAAALPMADVSPPTSAEGPPQAVPAALPDGLPLMDDPAVVSVPRLGGGGHSPGGGRHLVKAAAGDAKGLSLSGQQRLLILDTWRRSGLPAGDFAELVGLSKYTLYTWKKRFEEDGPAGLMERPRAAGSSKVSEVIRRSILMLKQDHPDWGCQRISDVLLRGPGLGASPGAVSRVLHDAGYELVEEPSAKHPDHQRRFERATPNQLWQTDLFTFMLKRQNRRVYLVAFMDDHSRYIVSYGLHASQSAALVLEVLRAGITSCGTPQEILTDNGSQYVTWRGTSAFAKELQKRGIRQVVASPRHPETLGKIERFWGSLWRECLQAAVFIDLADAQCRIGHYIDYYNFRRPHQGLDGLVPADRFFQLAPQVKETLQARVSANALDLARTGLPKAPFYLTGHAGGQAFSVHAEGERVILSRPGQERQEVDLVPPPAPSETMPAPVCSVGQVEGDLLIDEAVPPGTSPLDDGLRQISQSLSGPPAEEGGQS